MNAYACVFAVYAYTCMCGTVYIVLYWYKKEYLSSEKPNRFSLFTFFSLHIRRVNKYTRSLHYSFHFVCIFRMSSVGIWQQCEYWLRDWHPNQEIVFSSFSFFSFLFSFGSSSSCCFTLLRINFQYIYEYIFFEG